MTDYENNGFRNFEEILYFERDNKTKFKAF